jgi:zinc protease
MRLMIIVYLLFSSVSLYAMTTVKDIQSFTLQNGMKIIVLEDHSIPNANMYLFWKVGSRNEVPGITGLSHFFEHMMFNGSKKYGPKEFDRVMEANGGSNNAYTSENITVYTDWFPSSAIETIFDLEADRIGNLALDDNMIESERGVVLSERITGLENSNWYFLNEQVKSVAFMAHPYRWSVIGYESDIKNWKKEDLQKYFETYYAPNNAVVVMIGDLTLSEVKELAQKFFEPIPAHKPPRPVHTVEPEQLGERRLWVTKDVSTSHIMIAYHVPETKSDDYYELDILSSILSDGRSSRLYNTLVDKKQLAIRVFTYYPHSFDPNLFYFYAVCNKDIHENDLEQAIYEEVETIISDGINEKELQKVKNRKLVEFYHEMETINGKANTIGTYEIFFGDYGRLFSAPEDYKKVTIEDVQNIAARYFRKSNRTVGILKSTVEETK